MQNTKSTSPLAVSRGRIARPQKVVAYGPEGVGKSTLASQTPEPVFLDTEGGTHHLDVVRVNSTSTWEQITAAVAALAKGGHEFKTLVIDTADWLEKRLVEHLCRKHSKSSIEDFGYGKGYVILAEEFAKFLASLDALLARGMHVVFLAHSQVRKFEAPDQAGSYDRFELKLSKQVAPLLKEWADVVLFGNYVTRLAEKDSGKHRGVGGKERVLFANHTAAFDAKNRHGLGDKLPFSIDALEPVFGAVTKPKVSAKDAPSAKPASVAKADTPAGTEESSVTDRIFAEFSPHMADVVDFLIDRGQLNFTEEGPAEDFSKLDPDYAARMLAEPKRFLQAVQDWVKGKEAAK
jgi:hypothetical protein